MLLRRIVFGKLCGDGSVVATQVRCFELKVIGLRLH